LTWKKIWSRGEKRIPCFRCLTLSVLFYSFQNCNIASLTLIFMLIFMVYKGKDKFGEYQL